ncbi:MAG: glycosyltransferase family 39 protein [bacterium]|nr:glycosyltransferase family 39 protein [bacterium]
MNKTNRLYTFFAHEHVKLLIDICCPLAVWILVYCPYLKFYLLHIDTAGYLLAGQMILDGAVPFLDFWDNKPPFVYQLFALILKCSGRNNFIAVTIATLAFNCISTILLYKIIRLFSSRFTACIAAFLYPVLSHLMLFRDSISPNAEMYMTTFELCALLIGIHAILKKSIRLIILAGISAGIATAFKQPGGVIVCVLSIGWILYHRNTSEWKSVWKPISALILGTGSIWLLIIGYFWHKNALWDFWFLSFEFNFIYSSGFSKLDILKSLMTIYRDYMMEYPLIFLPYFSGIIASVYTIAKRTAPPLLRFFFSMVLLWHAGDLLGTAVSGLFFYHYFVQLMPSFVVLTVVPNLHYLYGCLQNRQNVFFAGTTIYAAILFMHLFFPHTLLPSFDRWNYIPPQHMLKKNSVYSKHYGNEYYLNPVYRHPDHTLQVRKMIEIIRAYVPADKPLFVWGSSPDVYIWSNRKPASRFIYASFIQGNFHGLSKLKYTEKPQFSILLTRMQKMLLDDLNTSKPVMIAVTINTIMPHTAFFWDYLNTHYERLPIQQPLPADFYILKEQTSPDMR